MIKRIFNKLNFLALKSSVQSQEHFTARKPFDQLDSKLIRESSARLEPYYLEYVREISSPEMAASLELASFMFSLCKINRYHNLLDLGSGLSSFVFRLYAKEEPGVTVYSIDDDAAWLDKTRSYLAKYELDTSNMYTLDEFLKMNEQNFDCILHDLNFVEVRINYVEQIMGLAAKKGLIIFDDVHKPDYLRALLVKLKQFEAEKYDVKPLTNDAYGRFSLAVLNGK